MNDDDRFLNDLRSDARALRYEPEAMTLTRVSARIASRISEREETLGVVAAWFRPLVGMLSAVLIVGASTLALVAYNNTDPLSSVAEAKFMQEDYYGGAQ